MNALSATLRRQPAWIVALAALVIVLDVALVAVRGTAQTPGPQALLTTPPPSPTASAAPGETLEQQLARVARLVSEVRSQSFKEVPRPTYVSRRELARRAAEFVDEYTPEEAETDQHVLTLLGAIPAGTDLRATLRSALSEQVAGFYDAKKRELVVANEGGGRLGPLDEVTLAHELEHALAHQTLGLPQADEGQVRKGQEDAAFARQALVEGDATLTMILYAQRALTPADQARLLVEQAELAGQLGRMTPLPQYIQRSLTFPYEEGLSFVSALRDAGSWQAIDRAYAQLPTSTLQILRPDLYLAGQGGGRNPRDVAGPGGSWTRGPTLSFGAADLMFLFEAPGNATARRLPDPRASAIAWEGGEATLFVSGARRALGLALEGGPPLCDALGAWYPAAFPTATPAPGVNGARTFRSPGQTAALRCAGTEVRMGIAPDVETALALAA